MKPLVYVLNTHNPEIGQTELRALHSTFGDAVDFFVLNEGDDDPLPDRFFEADAIIVDHRIDFSADLINRLQRCKALIRNGVGFNNVDLETAQARGIPVCNVPDYGTEEVADHAIALAMTLHRRIIPLHQDAVQADWNVFRHSNLLRRTSHQVFGIVGLGRIGLATALRAKALGFQVQFYDPYLSQGTDKAVGIARVKHLQSILRESDILSLHCPLSKETYHLIDSDAIALMKPTSSLVNTARGPVVDTKAVVDALQAGTLAGAGLDVVETEPNPDPAIVNAPNMIVTCHAAFCSHESIIELHEKACLLALAAIRGEPLWNLVYTSS